MMEPLLLKVRTDLHRIGILDRRRDDERPLLGRLSLRLNEADEL